MPLGLNFLYLVLLLVRRLTARQKADYSMHEADRICFETLGCLYFCDRPWLLSKLWSRLVLMLPFRRSLLRQRLSCLSKSSRRDIFYAFASKLSSSSFKFIKILCIILLKYRKYHLKNALFIDKISKKLTFLKTLVSFRFVKASYA